ncbi:hypothetical protein EYW49_14840 [Siculibacillus lacustris]|uniref:histidine kinase n=1 Tax=Siculibacillus lacustris TaxID=1549641 RepID=A0A4Q9VKZ4_9HYPH|nr:ATP-binding protein [Siculibacillus lacustris]TBW36120.1 hypothetical protein EYW49_14840 [Siculibacillus lacustris]
MLNQALWVIDSFIPGKATMERADLSVARNFVFTHLIGPTLSQVIGVYLYRTDPEPGFACWTMITCITLFWVLPVIYRWTGNLPMVSILSVQLLTFTSLFGTFNYGGVSSPFLPWLSVALLLGFFYLAGRTLIVLGLFAVNFLVFVIAYLHFGFPEIVPLTQLESVGWISILSATVYMSWMAIYYANIMSMRSELEIEMERHRKTTENLVETKSRADDASRAKSIFLAKMSHEFRTPLNAIIGYSELVLETLEFEAGSPQTVSDLNRINASGKHLLALINDILDLSKIESDTVELTAVEFSLDRFCNDLAQTVEPMVAKNFNTLSLQGVGRLGTVVADETKLRQILLNLLSNAAKFTNRGAVTLGVKRQKISDLDWVEFRVVDTGIGIASTELQKLFANYQQASASTSRKYGGTGLGLAISQRLSAFMGGSIAVTSEPGRGSCFTVRVPVTGPAEPTSSLFFDSSPKSLATVI